MSLVTLTINNKKIEVEEGTTILNAAKKLNINIPTLCHLKIHDNKTENHPGSCRVCVVEVEGKKNLAPACCTPVTEGMVVKTNSIKAIQARRTMVELLLSDHPQDCLLCEKNTECELQSLAADMGIKSIRYTGEISRFPKDTSSFSIVRDLDKCILCRRCVTMCNDVQTVGVLSAVDRGFNTVISPAFSADMLDTNCTFCGQCVAVCPTGALTEVNNTSKVWDALDDTDKVVIIQTAPAIRAALGEEFGLEPGTVVTGKMVSALHALGFHKVFDTDFAADLTILEEANELIHRLEHGGRLPMLTSCCPGWIKFFEHQFSDLLDIPSTCKSPQQMFGAIAKTYLAEKMGINPKNLVVVSVMPCLAKKYEAARPEMSRDGIPDVDIVISTRELAKMIKEAGIDFNSLEDDSFDNPLGESTGAAAIFGVTGGVMEAALRTAYEVITKEDLKDVNFIAVRGMKGIKEATIKIKDMDVKVAIASGLGNARKLLQNIREGKAYYHMIEIMACPGGCIDGGGQPYMHENINILEKRMEALYKEDSNKTLRKSHENPFIIKLYKEFLGEPYGEKAHELLHTTYIKR
ncbi:NADH-quinone oxidoreductase subunit G [Clostridium tetanomorphum]|uniref:2Fe-2S iron-sulfur cluster binding domain-containing protein n=2 Tax=Clostridium TaxID=1485 RepID=A0A923EDY5_CLOTT|nr:NADH-dependent [FeFe] hydrogenase, group A6 [Clostridium tetanomorphum]KAJ51195.1 iron hydrogenase 1 [Clostridium tetanomorphum DSM 665]KAJ53896.1 iron hydrogenase 1 [Clostridium tetanomorphum DSM 665]MBC2399018.1 2Fe-2S iron-sulfur cluster binding domain-containing protein [Clostridium tetanomorphum]MBP1862631.1 NADH-quinone oxidoreductase subunit G [Clostridium tetanomorphum]NRS85528.1 NADH-quinone oxidoreductase subunit G [Clostridium tetanomorphum]